jgi:hypothetical protein
MKKALFSLLVSALALQGCGETALPDPNPQGSNGLDIEIDLKLSANSALRTVGRSLLVNTHKVLVARYSANDFSAVQSYCPSDQSTNLTYNHADLTYRCSKDNSVYDINGRAKSGSSTNLKLYYDNYRANEDIIRIFE